MKLKYNFIIQNVGGKSIAVATDKKEDSFNGMIKLNNSGRYIFEQLQNKASKDEIIAALAEKYNISQMQAQTDVTEFITDLSNCGLIENDN